MKCINCGSTETDIDNQLGHVVCTQCGSVLEQDSMVSEVQFIENKGQALLDGFTIKAGQGMNENDSINHNCL
jgi:transcription factor IIIB subunit 2